MTTKVIGEDSGGVLVPALGESWGQASSTRVILFWEGPQRYAHLLKASAAPEGAAAAAAGLRLQQRQGAQREGIRAALAVAYDITEDGVRGAAAGAAAAAAGPGG